MSKILFLSVVACICYTVNASHRSRCFPRVPGSLCTDTEDCIALECCNIPRRSGVQGICAPLNDNCFENVNCPGCIGDYQCQLNYAIPPVPGLGRTGTCVLSSTDGRR